uniref:Unannotated protein n=1 Tax=freshwater metagenome TaxID=449393 RepID=A0A6J5ZRN5_9ZZZZ
MDPVAHVRGRSLVYQQCSFDAEGIGILAEVESLGNESRRFGLPDLNATGLDGVALTASERGVRLEYLEPLAKCGGDGDPAHVCARALAPDNFAVRCQALKREPQRAP